MEEEKHGGSPTKNGGVRKALYAGVKPNDALLTDARRNRLESIRLNQGETPLWNWMEKEALPRTLVDILQLISQCIELGWADVLETYLARVALRKEKRAWDADLVLKSAGGFRDVSKEEVMGAAGVLLRWLPKSPVAVRTLWIEGLPLSVTALCGALSACKELRELRVINAGLGDADAKELAKGLAAGAKLSHLTLRGCKFQASASALDLVTAILKHPALEAIELSACGFGKNSSDALQRLLTSSRLIAIDLSNHSFSGKEANFLAGLKHNHSLRRLTLNSCWLDQSAESVLAQALPHAKVTHLCLEKNKLSPGFASSASTLTWLSIAHSTAPDLASGIQAIEKSKSLKYLSLAGIDLGHRKSGDQKALDAVVRLIGAGAPLAHLVLRGCGIRDAADLDRVLRACMFNGALQTLDLAGNFGLMEGPVDFEGLAGNKSLIELDLGSNYLLPEAQQKLWAALARNTTLQVLKLSKTMLDFSVGAFAVWIDSNTKVHTLDFSGHALTFKQLLPLIEGVAKSTVIENLSVDVDRRPGDEDFILEHLLPATDSNRKLIHMHTNLACGQQWYRMFTDALRRNFKASMGSVESCRLLVDRLVAEWQQPGDVPVLPTDMWGVVWSYLSGPTADAGNDQERKRQRERLRLSLKLRLVNRRLSGLSPLPALAHWPDLPLPDLPDSDDEAELGV